MVARNQNSHLQNAPSPAARQNARRAQARPRTALPMRSVLATLAAALLAGCTAPSAEPGLSVPRGSSAELIHHISQQPYVTADAGYRAIYALAKGQTFPGAAADTATGSDFGALTGTLEADKLVDASWEYAPERYLTRSDTGYMVCRTCNIRTGVNWNLTGLGRYAWRELIYHEIAQPGNEFAPITGGEFLAVILKANLHLREHGSDAATAGLEKPNAEP